MAIVEATGIGTVIVRCAMRRGRGIRADSRLGSADRGKVVRDSDRAPARADSLRGIGRPAMAARAAADSIPAADPAANAADNQQPLFLTGR